MGEPMACHKQDMCNDIGMEQIKHPSAALRTYIHAIAPGKLPVAEVGTTDLSDTSINARTTGTQRNKDGEWFGDSKEGNHKDQKITNAEQGKYVIQYHVSDKEGNHECETLLRTVIVKDTLPPVITLALNNKLIHFSDAGSTGMDGQSNPAGPFNGKTVNPFMKTPSGVAIVGADGMIGSQAPNVQSTLMAEAVNSNSWIIGAVASAVAGVALLGY